MVQAGFSLVLCNVGDYGAEQWAVVREEAQQAGAVCGPWLRTTDGHDFRPEFIDSLIRIADEWEAPFVVNSEKELDGSGNEYTTLIDSLCEGHDWALSMEPWPFASVDWGPIHAPVLPQLFGPEWGVQEEDALEEWFRVGIKCVVPTYGTYSGWQPEMYGRLTPFGLYTADDCGNDYASWSPLGVYEDRCGGGGVTPVPDPGGGMIGSQDGIVAAFNRLRDLDNKGTKLVKGADGKWPSLETLEDVPLDQWKAYDKLQRTIQILKNAHG